MARSQQYTMCTMRLMVKNMKWRISWRTTIIKNLSLLIFDLRQAYEIYWYEDLETNNLFVFSVIGMSIRM